MASDVLARVDETAEALARDAEEAEALGRLPDKTADLIRETGVIRMLQGPEWGGYAASPVEFAQAVLKLATASGSAGWVAGVVGVHPWEMAFADRRVQEEVWSGNPETWIASPYALVGRAAPAGEGFLLSGRWQFSSGTDHCDWIFLGGVVADSAEPRHFILPRTDYTIVPDSWDVVGLRGTGSKDILVENAYVPAYRTLHAQEVFDGRAAAYAGRTESVFRMPFSAVFPCGIAAATLGIAQGALAAAIEYQRARTNLSGAQIADDPWVLGAIGEAAGEIAASRRQLLDGLTEMYNAVRRDEAITLTQRLAGRRDQTRLVWRAVRAIDQVFDRAGGRALHLDQPLQRLWRDGHAGLHHVINVSDYVCSAYAKLAAGMPVEDSQQLYL